MKPETLREHIKRLEGAATGANRAERDEAKIELLTLARDLDPDGAREVVAALARLYDRGNSTAETWGPLRRYAFSICRDTNIDPEGVVQETLIKLIEKRHTFQKNTLRSADSYVLRIASNTFLDGWRSDTSRRRREDDHYRAYHADEVTAISTEHTVHINRRVNHVLGQLRPRDADLLIMYYHERMSLSELASIFDLAESSMKTTIHRARTRFINMYERDRRVAE